MTGRSLLLSSSRSFEQHRPVIGGHILREPVVMLWQLDQSHASRCPLDDAARSQSTRQKSTLWLDDHAIGAIGLAGCISSFTYYSAWTLLTPFLPDSSPLLALFPLSREWAIRIPALVILVGLSFVGMLTGAVLVQTARSNGATLRGRGAHRTGSKAHKGD